MSARHLAVLVMGAALAITAPFSANATVITKYGDTVDFTFDDAAVGLYGTPKVAGDILYFEPNSFSAISYGTLGNVTTQRSIDITVTPKSGFIFDSLSVLELGDYYAFGPGTSVNASANLHLEKGVESKDVPLMSSSDFSVRSQFQTTNWEIYVADIAGWDSSFDLTLTNTLTASSTITGSLALIEKKYAGIIIKTNAVPEPSTRTILLLGLGLLGLGFRARRTPAQE